MWTDSVPFLLGEADVALFYQAADGTAITTAPVWFGCKARQMVMNKSRESFRMASTGAEGITTYQGNTIHRIEIGKAWVLPIEGAVMQEFDPARNQRFVLQLAWADPVTKLTHQRIYFGVVFESENLTSKGALDFTQRQACSATWMEQNAC